MSFICPLCAEPMDSIVVLQLHCINIHTRYFVSCRWCTMPFSSQDMLQQHAAGCKKFDKERPREGDVNTSAYIKDDRCAPCEWPFDSYEAALKHYKVRHLNYKYVCVECQECFDVHKHLERHYVYEHPRPCTSAQALSSRAVPSTSTAMSPSLSNGNDSTTSVSDQPNSANTRAKQKNPFTELARSEQLSYRMAFQKNRCYGCKIQFTIVDETAQHFKTVHNTKVHFCRDCNHMYLLRSNRKKHNCTKRQHSATVSQSELDK